VKNKNDNIIIMSGGVVNLNKYTSSAHIKIEHDTILNAINLHNNMDLKFEVEKNATLTFNMFDYATTLKTKLDIELYDDSKFNLNVAFITEQKYELDINTKLYGDNISANVNVRGINEREGITRISMDGVVAGETHGCVINEYAKIINKSTFSNVLIPNLIVNTNDVEANHGVTVSHIDEGALFYLMSKGLDKISATKILEEGFILSIMDDDVKNTIKNILVGR